MLVHESSSLLEQERESKERKVRVCIAVCVMTIHSNNTMTNQAPRVFLAPKKGPVAHVAEP